MANRFIHALVCEPAAAVKRMPHWWWIFGAIAGALFLSLLVALFSGGLGMSEDARVTASYFLICLAFIAVAMDVTINHNHGWLAFASAFLALLAAAFVGIETAGALEDTPSMLVAWLVFGACLLGLVPALLVYLVVGAQRREDQAPDVDGQNDGHDQRKDETKA